MRLSDLLLGKDYFYLMHLSYNGSRKKALWNFAREHEIVGLDRSDINGDWLENREEFVRRLKSENTDNGWVKQFDLFCEDTNNESIANGDIVIAMAGKDFVLGIGRVIGPHEYRPTYKRRKEFFDHVRSVEWIVEYDYERRKAIDRVQFQNTLRRIEETQEKDQKIWLLFSELDFKGKPQLVNSTSTMQKPNPVEALKKLADIQTQLTKETRRVSRYKRSRELVQKLKEIYGYRCQICSPSTPTIPQIPMRDGRNYIEVHHIRGFNEISTATGNNQDNGNYVVDDYKNVIAVCVYHHKLLHKHKNKYHYDSEKKCFVSEDKTSTVSFCLNEHL